MNANDITLKIVNLSNLYKYGTNELLFPREIIVAISHTLAVYDKLNMSDIECFTRPGNAIVLCCNLINGHYLEASVNIDSVVHITYKIKHHTMYKSVDANINDMESIIQHCVEYFQDCSVEG